MNPMHNLGIRAVRRFQTALLGALLLAIPPWQASYAQQKEWSPDAQIELMETHVKVTPDGRLETRNVRRIRLLSPMAFNQLTDPRILIDREYEELVVETARVILPDGSIVETPQRARTMTTPDAVALAPSFGQFSEWVISLVGVQPGSTLELAWIVRDRLQRRTHYEGLFVLGDRFPITEARITLDLPARLPLQRLGIYPGGRPIPEDEPVHKAANTVYGWRLRDIPARGGLPETALYRFPIVAFSTAGTWQELLTLSQQRMAKGATDVGAAVLAAMEPQLRNLPEGLERYVAIVQGLAQRIRRVGHEVVSVSLPARELATVWATREATPLEMALLTTCVLHAAGASAQYQVYEPWGGEKGQWPASLVLGVQTRIALRHKTWGEIRFAPFATEPDSLPQAALGGAIHFVPIEGPIQEVRLFTTVQPAAVALDIRATVRAKGASLVMELQAKGTGAANPWYKWGRTFGETQAKAALADLLVEGSKIESVSLRSWGPEESEFLVTATLPLTKGPLLMDFAPLSSWVEPWVQSRLDPTAPPCPMCRANYRFDLQLLGQEFTLTTGLAPTVCGDDPTCLKTTLEFSPGIVQVSRTLTVSPVSTPDTLIVTLKRFLSDNRSRGVLMWTSP